MKKKIAVFLILVLMCNMTLLGDDGDDRRKEPTGINSVETQMTIAVVACIIFVPLMIWGFLSWVGIAQADSPDDGIKMTSMESEELTNTSGNNLLNVLQHVEAGVTQNNDVYLGLRFQY